VFVSRKGCGREPGRSSRTKYVFLSQSRPPLTITKKLQPGRQLAARQRTLWLPTKGIAAPLCQPPRRDVRIIERRKATSRVVPAAGQQMLIVAPPRRYVRTPERSRALSRTMPAGGGQQVIFQPPRRSVRTIERRKTVSPFLSMTTQTVETTLIQTVKKIR
jgi:hypothetical protein